MALIGCPECGNMVSDKAVACPKCGYPIKEYSILEQSNNEIFLSEDDKKVLIALYLELFEHFNELDREYEEYKEYKDTFPDFGDETCIQQLKEGLIDIYINKCDDILYDVNEKLVSLENEDLGKEIDYSFAEEIEDMIGEIIAPYFIVYRDNCNNVLKQVEHEYELEVAQKSDLGFGVMTSSFIGAALYAWQSTTKEAKAKEEALINKTMKESYEISKVGCELKRAWDENYESEFLSRVNAFKVHIKEVLEIEIFGDTGIIWDDIYTWVDEIYGEK